MSQTNKCVCGDIIRATLSIKHLGECFHCRCVYKLNNDEWIKISRDEFKSLYKIGLISKQWGF